MIPVATEGRGEASADEKIKAKSKQTASFDRVIIIYNYQQWWSGIKLRAGMWKNAALSGFWDGKKSIGNKGDFICEMMLIMA